VSYATLDDLLARYSLDELLALADRDSDGVIDAAVVDAALADASEVIDGYLAARHQVPLASVPGIVRGWACDIARHRLHKDSPPDAVTRAYDEAMRQLRDVAGGRLVLQVGGQTSPAAETSDSQVLFEGGRQGPGVDRLDAW